jgi:cold shock CspA family protein
MSDTIAVTSVAHDIGCVKWFNNKSGFGFITVSTGEHKGTDIFVHHTGVVVSNDQQYRYLVQGEYVELAIEESDNEKYKFKAVNVSGISGGKLMCETRHNMKQDRQPSENDQGGDNKRSAGPREKGFGAKRTSDGTKEVGKNWTVVPSRNKQTKEQSLVM